MAHRVQRDEEEDDDAENVVDGIEDAHEEDFAKKDEVRDAFLS